MIDQDQDQDQEKIKRLKESTLRTLAKSGKEEALRRLEGYLNEYGMTEVLGRAMTVALAGELETDEGVRAFINSI